MKETGSRSTRIEQCISPVDCGIEVPMHKNRFPALRYANNDRHKGALSSVQRMEQRKSENTDDIEANHRRREAEQEKTRALCRRVLTKSIFLLWRFLSDSLYFD
ncbi:hypothetical protein T12_6652 [Trichinella patagoniensis]|uniref:Uncharacterized protein n=1 Tax=Trichinella patagoniensis TaxID=990121 RepID=A0A0V0ZG91_9BILA|nr:hypothetical protein T12_6652 [Trichinella patagoniensis]